MKSDLSAPTSVPKLLEKKYQKTYEKSDNSDYNDSDDTKSEEDDEEDERISKFVNSARPKNETTEEKKVCIFLFNANHNEKMKYSY